MIPRAMDYIWVYTPGEVADSSYRVLQERTCDGYWTGQESAAVLRRSCAKFISRSSSRH